MKKLVTLFQLFIILFSPLILCSKASASAEIILSQDFENGWSDWSADNGVWEVGTPTVGPTACHGGTKCAGTVLGGKYPEDTASRLISPSIILPSVTGNEEIHLRFWQWFSFEVFSEGYVQISTYDPSTGRWSSYMNISEAIEGTNPIWSQMDVDLTQYAGKKVRIGFLHAPWIDYSDAGWYIDDITIDGVSSPVLSVNPIIQNVAKDAGTTTFSISNTGTGTMPWTAAVTSGDNWLSITSGVSGSNTGTITCSYSANTTTSSRTATIRVTASGVMGSPMDVMVIQAPSPTVCTATLDGKLLLHIPYLSYVNPIFGTVLLWTDLVYEFNPTYPTLLPFKLTNYVVINDPSFSCVASTLYSDFKIHIPDLLLPDGITHIRVDLEYSSTLSTNGNAYFVVTNYGVVSN